MANNQIGCPSPATRINAKDFTEETVEIELALNGQDFVEISIPFRFVGTKPAGEPVAAPEQQHREKWFVTALIGGIVLVYVLYVIVRAVVPRSSKGKFPLVEQSDKPQRKNF